MPDEFKSLSFLPDPKMSSDGQYYEDFDIIYQQQTSEKFHPSYSKLQLEEHKPGIFVNNLIRLLVACNFCRKYQYIYSKFALNDNEIEFIIQHLENILYSCGLPIVSDNNLLSDSFHICLNLTCNSPIEHNYYSCQLKDVDLCYWCSTKTDLLEIPNDLQN
ncbi:10527_t:CDS:2 [Cetraspora pellucida]|uniref:10527_t:CDS:1 n=1 Tax=Cetraspora pellucida TaxID=1433469 RepID=A0ACA9L495_9GLOM|nr:10527_t:CDS:2 [Cetraspora pellucida]